MATYRCKYCEIEKESLAGSLIRTGQCPARKEVLCSFVRLEDLDKDAGRKDDTGKLRYDLIPPYALQRLAEVYTIGAGKYEDRNWEKGIPWGRIFAAMMRHAWAWWNGEQNDQVDGQHHLASVAWTAFALMEYEITHPELDDRPGALRPVVPTKRVGDPAHPPSPKTVKIELDDEHLAR